MNVPSMVTQSPEFAGETCDPASTTFSLAAQDIAYEDLPALVKQRTSDSMDTMLVWDRFSIVSTCTIAFNSTHVQSTDDVILDFDRVLFVYSLEESSSSTSLTTNAVVSFSSTMLFPSTIYTEVAFQIESSVLKYATGVTAGTSGGVANVTGAGNALDHTGKPVPWGETIFFVLQFAEPFVRDEFRLQPLFAVLAAFDEASTPFTPGYTYVDSESPLDEGAFCGMQTADAALRLDPTPGYSLTSSWATMSLMTLLQGVHPVSSDEKEYLSGYAPNDLDFESLTRTSDGSGLVIPVRNVLALPSRAGGGFTVGVCIIAVAESRSQTPPPPGSRRLMALKTRALPSLRGNREDAIHAGSSRLIHFEPQTKSTGGVPADGGETAIRSTTAANRANAALLSAGGAAVAACITAWIVVAT